LNWSKPVNMSLEVKPRVNQRPIATVESVWPNPVAFGQPVTFNGSGIDPDGIIIDYMWFSGNVTLSHLPVFSLPSFSVGNHTVYFQVQDNDTAWSDTVPVSVVVSPLIPPTAEILSVAPNPANSKQQVTFEGRGSDVDGVVAGYMWNSSLNDFLSDSASFSTSNLSVGNHTIFFWVRDNSSLWSNPDTVLLEVLNQIPSATINSNVPKSAVRGQAIVFNGSGSDLDGEVVNCRWISSIDGFLSNSMSFSTANLSVGIHNISFQVQDNLGAWSRETPVMLTVDNPQILPSWAILSAVLGGGLVGGAAVWVLRPVKPDPLGKAPAPEEKGTGEGKKRKERKRKPRIEVKTTFPTRVTCSKSYEMQVKVRNMGFAEAKNVSVTAFATPGLSLKKKGERIQGLKPFRYSKLIYPLELDKHIVRGFYVVRLEAKSKEASKTKACCVRAMKLALLAEGNASQTASSLRIWLSKNSYACDELFTAENLSDCLLKYDLLILPADTELPLQWMHNISSFVENGQSLLVLGNVVTSEKSVLAETLGYVDMECKDIKFDQSALNVCNNQHPITFGLKLGSSIPIENCQGSVCVSRTTTATILANSPLPALLANEYGNGKVVHLNFPAETFTDQLDQILERVVEWLLADKEQNPRVRSKLWQTSNRLREQLNWRSKETI
jgi:hypothetical protein